VGQEYWGLFKKFNRQRKKYGLKALSLLKMEPILTSNHKKISSTLVNCNSYLNFKIKKGKPVDSPNLRYNLFGKLVGKILIFMNKFKYGAYPF